MRNSYSLMITSDLLQIQQAAAGGCSGYADEWPYLVMALHRAGYVVPDDTSARELIRMSRDYLKKHPKAVENEAMAHAVEFARGYPDVGISRSAKRGRQ